MTEKQEQVLKRFAKLRNFDFDTQIQVGQEIATLNELKAFQDKAFVNDFISAIFQGNYKIYFDKEKYINDFHKNQQEKHDSAMEWIKKSRIKNYEDWIEIYENWNNDEQHVELTKQDLEVRIAQLKRLLEKEKNIL